MKNILTLIIFLGTTLYTYSQKLSVAKIMQDPKNWVGTSPSNVYWSEDGKTIYFQWNPEKNPGDSLYKVTKPWKDPIKVSYTEQRNVIPEGGNYNTDKSKKVFSRDGDLFLADLTGKTGLLQITNTGEAEINPKFIKSGEIVFNRRNNLYKWDYKNGTITQITNVKKGDKPKEKKESEQNEWLKNQQKELIKVLKEEEEKNAARDDYRDRLGKDNPVEIYLDNKSLSGLDISPDGRYITVSLYKSYDGQRTIVPDFVTVSGYTEELNSRKKVGQKVRDLELWIYDLQKEHYFNVSADTLTGLYDQPDYKVNEDSAKREVLVMSPSWSKDGKAITVVRSKDNKDRWIASIDLSDGSLKELDRQRDEAWIGGPGVGWTFSKGTIGWMPDNEHIYYQSEVTGYSHLYLLNITTGKKKALTSGKFEVYNPVYSSKAEKWFFAANPDHPGERSIYSVPAFGGKIKKITDLDGKAEAIFSRDFSKMAILHSISNRPEELYFYAFNDKKAEPVRITHSQTEEWLAYSWRKPEFVTFKARDGAEVHARLYQPEQANGGPAVIFVHGAGYLQNAHKWWSSYFREYMFHNLLVDKGYTVLDIDYRGSAGYGRDWRTGIYRHMGGFDLTDQVDGAKFLEEEYRVNPSKIGIYGGSYGGFITLMAMFTEPGAFAAGAALRSVTDWAHYNHGYTSNILNTPVEDSTAYRRSSPIYFAEGLEGALLICHGMIDTNVHFQDVVRLAQRLIELGKQNWEFAVYPKEGHGFKYPESWTDEYRRILKLFEENLKDD